MECHLESSRPSGSLLHFGTFPPHVAFQDFSNGCLKVQPHTIIWLPTVLVASRALQGETTYFGLYHGGIRRSHLFTGLPD
ncbi:hypothetical protein RvY_01485 [Ramazzottius varieornatus]|uniref:Uncharacterized protein n=1 Tax=Ramazzottius varieornatus TaxID=947166 RepID=A0A1D1UGU9_RAMVA|nr:hypothetical protein RvY_01485 [Ramazzottius varieornatus]